MKLSLRTVTWFALPLSLAAAAFAQLRSVGAADASFDARGPGGINIHGTTNSLSVSENDGKVTVTVPLAGLTTGIGLRDTHMKDTYLEVAKYPDAVLTVDRSELHPPAPGQSNRDRASGIMTIHGVSRQVNFRYEATEHDGTTSVEGTSHIDIRDFNVNVPNYLGVGVDPHVDLTVHFGVTDH